MCGLKATSAPKRSRPEAASKRCFNFSCSSGLDPPPLGDLEAVVLPVGSDLAMAEALRAALTKLLNTSAMLPLSSWLICCISAYIAARGVVGFGAGLDQQLVEARVLPVSIRSTRRPPP